MSTVEEIKAMTSALIENGVEATKASKFAEEFGAKTVKAAALGAEAQKMAASAFEQTTKAVQAAYESMLNLNTSTLLSGDAFDQVKTRAGALLALTTKFDAFNHIGVDGGKHINTMGQSLTELTAKMGSWGAVVKAFPNTLGALGGKTMEVAQRFLEHVSQAQHLENAYINLQGASGGLGKVFDKDGRIVDNLSTQVQHYGKQLADVEAITGENIETVAQFASKLYIIPNLLNEVVNTGGKAGDSTTALAAAMTLAKGAGQSNETVLSVMKTAYEDLSNSQGKVTDTGKKGTEMFALMAQATKTLGLRFSDTESYLTTVAKEFQLVGDNTEGATNILTHFSDALQNTGLTAKASIGIIQNMVTSMNHLEMGTKSLISARSGGPGGLQGAFQVEELLRKGKTPQVSDMLMKSFKQQAGGKIYTQAEAAQSPQAAAQFMRQREMLKSGAFGGMAKDDQSATHLLEAMAKGNMETTAVLNATTAVKDVAAQGTNLQEQQVDILKVLNQGVDRGNIIGNQILLATARGILGTGRNDDGTKELTAFMDEARNDLAATPRRADEKAGETAITSKQFGIAADRSAQALKIAPRRIADSVRGANQQLITYRAHQPDKVTQQEQGRSTRATTRGAEEKYMSLFHTPNPAAHTLAAQATAVRAIGRPNALGRAMMPAGAKATEQAPAKVELTVRLADGLTATQTTQSPHAIVKANPLSGGTNYTKYDPHNPGY